MLNLEHYYKGSNKQEFIIEVMPRNPNLERILTYEFATLKSYEEELGKEVSNFTVKELLDYYKSLFSHSMDTLVSLNGRLRAYAEWSLRHNLVRDNQNHFEEITPELLNQCVNQGFYNQGIVSRQNLLAQIKIFKNACDKFLVLGIFEGLQGKGLCDFWDITMDDFEGNVVTLKSKRKLVVSDELVEYAKKSSEEDMFFSVSGSGETQDYKFKEGDNRIIKAMWNTVVAKETDTILSRRMLNKLVRLQKEYDVPYTRVLLRESGRIDMIKGLRKDGEAWKDTWNKYQDEISYRYGKAVLYKWEITYGKFLEEGEV